jgi:hypothetical protein
MCDAFLFTVLLMLCTDVCRRPRYHMEGAESWTMKALDYKVLCSSQLMAQNERHQKLLAHYVREAGLSLATAMTKSIDSLPLRRDQVIDHCRY